MIIQSSSNVVSAYLSTRIPSVQRQAQAAEPATVADTVVISQAARDLSASDSGIAQAKQSLLSKIAQSSGPDVAEGLAYDYSHIPDTPLVNLTEFINGTGPMRYTANGSPVTKESQAYFENIAPGVLQSRISLYNTEKAKGTPAADILDKVISYMDSQPTRYQEMINWHESAYGDSAATVVS